MSWINFEGEINEVNLAKAEVGDQISLRADSANELKGRKKELKKSAKALGITKLSWEKDEERFEMGTRPGTMGLWRNSRGHYAQARIEAKRVPLSPHGWGRQNEYAIDYGSTDHGAGTGLDLAVPGDSPGGFRSPHSNSGFGKEMGVRESAVHDRSREDLTACVPGNAAWYCSRSRSQESRRELRSTLERRLGRRLYPDEDAVDNNGEIVLTSRGW